MYGQSKLMIRRNYTMAYSARNVKVFVDGVNRGVASCNGFVVVDLRKGYHAVEIKMGRRTIGSANVEADGMTNITLRFKILNTGCAMFDAPVMDNFHNERPNPVAPPTATSNNNSVVQSPPQPTYHPNVYISTPPSSSSGTGCLVLILAAIILGVVLWIFSGVTVTYVFEIVPM